jgi:hypothetical protein
VFAVIRGLRRAPADVWRSAACFLSEETSMTPLDLVKLTPLMDRTTGTPDVTIGLIDGPVAMNHPELASRHIREISKNGSGACSHADSMACLHGTFVAGILSAKRGSSAPAICPDCTLLIRPVMTSARSSALSTSRVALFSNFFDIVRRLSGPFIVLFLREVSLACTHYQNITSALNLCYILPDLRCENSHKLKGNATTI